MRAKSYVRLTDHLGLTFTLSSQTISYFIFYGKIALWTISFEAKMLLAKMFKAKKPAMKILNMVHNSSRMGGNDPHTIHVYS